MLTNIPEVKLGIIAVSRDCFIIDLSERRRSAIVAACAYPFLQLGVQYLLYKLAGFLAGAVGASGLCRLIDGLGGAFGLVLGMTGSCALLLLISVLSSVAAVAP